MKRFFYSTFAFLSEKVFRNSKEKTVALVGAFTILTANLKYEIMYKLGVQLKLEHPNSTMLFPLPNRWSNPDVSMSKQQIYMVAKQTAVNFKDAGLKKRDRINEESDRSKGAISVMGFLDTLHLGEIDNIKLISEKYKELSQVTYNTERELLFGDSMINGENSYSIRKYGVNYYEIPESKKIDEDYRAAFEKSLKDEVWNDHCSQLGLTRDEVIKRVQQNDGVYTTLYEHLEKQSKGDVLQHTPEIYIENQSVDQTHYFHVPYPIFLKVKEGFACIGVGTRIKGETKIFSPFFANQGERVWRLVQSHVAQAAFNDFSVRTHLGIYHFTSNQYHVPVYRCLAGLKDKKMKENYHEFIDHSYGMFSRGLEGVNVAATATLVHPVEKYSLVNKALNLTQENTINIIADTSNNLKIYDFNPEAILTRQGISREELKQNFPKMSFDCELYEILSDYVEGVYKAFNMKEIEETLFTEINAQTKFMGVDKGQPRPELRNKEDVLKTLKNLCFIWSGFHSHTFSIISTATYALFRPSMLKKQIPSESQWEHIIVGDELPDSKILMENGKLNEATTQRDSDNFLTDNIKRKYEYAAYMASKHKSNPALSQSYTHLEKTAASTLKRLEHYEDKLVALNRERREESHRLTLEWMIPSQIQTSLNI